MNLSIVDEQKFQWARINLTETGVQCAPARDESDLRRAHASMKTEPWLTGQGRCRTCVLESPKFVRPGARTGAAGEGRRRLRGRWSAAPSTWGAVRPPQVPPTSRISSPPRGCTDNASYFGPPVVNAKTQTQSRSYHKSRNANAPRVHGRDVLDPRVDAAVWAGDRRRRDSLDNWAPPPRPGRRRRARRREARDLRSPARPAPPVKPPRDEIARGAGGAHAVERNARRRCTAPLYITLHGRGHDARAAKRGRLDRRERPQNLKSPAIGRRWWNGGISTRMTCTEESVGRRRVSEPRTVNGTLQPKRERNGAA